MVSTGDDLIEVMALGTRSRVKPGTRILDLLPARQDDEGRPFLAAVANHRLTDLDAPLFSRTEIQPITVSDPLGAVVYRRCATYLLVAAFADLFENLKLEIGQSMGNGYHFRVIGNAGQAPDLDRLSARMREIIAQNVPFDRTVVSVEAAAELFQARGYDDKLKLLRVWSDALVPIVQLGRFADIQHGPVALSTGSIDDFELLPKEPGFVLHFHTTRSPVWRRQRWAESSKLFDSYQETRKWNEILGVNTVGDLNELCLSGGVHDIIRIAEGFHEKKIAKIADRIADGRPTVRLVLIAGPSSSGKTTFSKRLATQLRVNGIKPVTLSLDNYYVDRVDTPKHPDGTYDFESIDAIDISFFNEQLADLLSGQVIQTPRFDFTRGVRVSEDKWRPMHLEEDQVLVVEGIHGLNDRLTASVPTEAKFLVFVSALTQLIIDRDNRVPTSDARLIRRIVRDRRYRGYSAAETIANWPSVRAGERRNLFPFQDQCDVMFNSALVYEPAVLKVLAERYLLEVPRDHPSTVVAHTLRRFLAHFVPIFPDEVPRTSILREFAGGSTFDY